MRQALSDPQRLPRIVIWSLVLSLLTFTVADPDLWGHVRFGQDILAARAIPSVDPYSFTSDRPWVNHEWLSEVAMAGAYAGGGALGLSLLKLLLLLMAAAVVARELASRNVPPIARDVLVTICFVSCVTLTRTVRPQTFSIAVFPVMLAALRRGEDGRPALLWIVPPLMALWANLHGGWLVGIGVVGVWTAIRVAVPCGPTRTRWAVAGLASLLATLATPEGTGMWRFLYETVGFDRADIGEWQSLTSVSPGDALPWVLTTIIVVVATVRGRAHRLTHFAVVALLLLASFKVWRLAPFFAIAGVLLLGPETVRRPARQVPQAPAPQAAALVIVALLTFASTAAAGVVSYRNLSCIRMSGDWIADRDAASAIHRSGITGNMLTWFDWGEYAIWFLSPAIKVSMDGRRETVYSDRMLATHLAIYRGEPGWEDGLTRLSPDYVWLPTWIPTVNEIERNGWRPLLRTGNSVLLSRPDRPSPSALPPPAVSQSAACFPGP